MQETKSKRLNAGVDLSFTSQSSDFPSVFIRHVCAMKKKKQNKKKPQKKPIALP